MPASLYELQQVRNEVKELKALVKSMQIEMEKLVLHSKGKETKATKGQRIKT